MKEKMKHMLFVAAGLVGIVTQVNANSAVVRSIIDDASNVSGMISKNRDICIVNGDLTLMDSGLQEMRQFPTGIIQKMILPYQEKSIRKYQLQPKTAPIIC